MGAWKCSKCEELIEDGFDTCWNCGTSSEGIEDGTFELENEFASPGPSEPTEVEGSETELQLTPQVASPTSLIKLQLGILAGAVLLFLISVLAGNSWDMGLLAVAALLTVTSAIAEIVALGTLICCRDGYSFLALLLGLLALCASLFSFWCIGMGALGSVPI